jgi:1-acyl-sn-glycerol-3-phosphate acyltransferase
VLLYRIVQVVFRLICVFWFRLGVEHADRVPPTGPVIICGNHFSWWDPLAIAVALRRPVYFMAKGELFRTRWFATLLRMVGAFPVRRGLPDRWVLRHTYALLERGCAVGIFPEGTRSRTGYLGRAEPGAAMVATRSGAPVVPVAIVGNYGFGTRVRVVFGDPIDLAAMVAGGRRIRNDELTAMSEMVMDRVIDLAGGAVYRRPGPEEVAAGADGPVGPGQGSGARVQE